MPTYTPQPAGTLQRGQKVRPLATVGPSVPQADRTPTADDYPWTVHSVTFLGQGRVRVWAWPFGSRQSITGPRVYGIYDEAQTVEVQA